MGDDHPSRRHSGRPSVLCEDVRRELIFNAVETVLQTHGYGGASMDRIAQSSNMSKKTLYHMFSSKQEMVEHLLRDRLLLPGLSDLDLKGETVEEQLVFGLNALSDEMLEEKRMSLIRVVIAEVSRNPEVSQFVREFFSSASALFPLKIWMQRLKDQGKLAINDVDEASDLLFGSALATSILCELSHCQPIMFGRDNRAYITRAVRHFLSGLATENRA